jgi:hypothetical protein
MTFSLEGTVMKFVPDNKGQTYYNGALKAVVMMLVMI